MYICITERYFYFVKCIYIQSSILFCVYREGIYIVYTCIQSAIHVYRRGGGAGESRRTHGGEREALRRGKY